MWMSGGRQGLRGNLQRRVCIVDPSKYAVKPDSTAAYCLLSIQVQQKIKESKPGAERSVPCFYTGETAASVRFGYLDTRLMT